MALSVAVRLFAASGLAIFMAAGAPGEQEKPWIETLRADARGQDVFVGFRLTGALNPQLATRIESGLETAIRYEA
ncbi:MAG TPA: hypothetical protein VIZ58_12385, partial [Thermoanaerobaculia bacterium]